MEFNPIENSCWSENYLNVDNLIHQLFKVSKNGEASFNSQQSNSSIRSALLDFYNDIKRYKDAVKKIKKVQNEIRNVHQFQNENLEIDQTSAINCLTIQSYPLLQPSDLLTERKPRRWRKIQGYSLPTKLSRSVSESEIQAGFNSK